MVRPKKLRSLTWMVRSCRGSLSAILISSSVNNFEMVPSFVVVDRPLVRTGFPAPQKSENNKNNQLFILNIFLHSFFHFPIYNTDLKSYHTNLMF